MPAMRMVVLIQLNIFLKRSPVETPVQIAGKTRIFKRVAGARIRRLKTTGQRAGS
jgi:hypothetical protein